MSKYDIFFRCSEMIGQQRVVVEAEDLRGANSALDEFAESHKVHIAHIDAIVPREHGSSKPPHRQITNSSVA